MESLLRVFGAPGRYLQGPGAIEAMGGHLGGLRGSAVLVADRAVLGLVHDRVRNACAAVGLSVEPLEFCGEITPGEIDRLLNALPGATPAAVIGAGGGKGIDAGKALADRIGCAVITLPTAASNDAPTSKNYVLYDHDHRLLRVEHLPRNPALVVVDTAVIVTAPLRMFTAGIGDAIVKKFEVAQCIGAGGRNLFGAGACLAAQALADLCHDTLRREARAAIEAVRANRVTDAVERVVEATVLHSGLGFESGGLSLSHAMTRGLSAVRGAREALHGHQVAYALLVQLILERRPDAFMTDTLGFYRDVGLPVRLADLGLEDATPAEFDAVAAGTMTAPHVRNFERALSAQDFVAAMTRLETIAA